MERFESIGYGLLIPFLFISIGMQTDFRAFGDAGNWLIIPVHGVGLVGSKVFSGWLADAAFRGSADPRGSAPDS